MGLCVISYLLVLLLTCSSYIGGFFFCILFGPKYFICVNDITDLLDISCKFYDDWPNCYGVRSIYVLSYTSIGQYIQNTVRYQQAFQTL